jgi:hypothetical protein
LAVRAQQPAMPVVGYLRVIIGIRCGAPHAPPGSGVVS